MAADIGMFGPGGEALGGLFTGQQTAQAQQQAAANTQQTLGEIANTAQIARQRELGNQYEEAIQPDKISAYKADVANKAEEAKYQKFERAGQQFGQFGAMLESVPPAARPAVLKQLASQAGVGEDNPMLQHLSTVDPNDLPNALTTLGAKVYEQGNTARAEKQKRDAMLAQAQMQEASRAQAKAEHDETLRIIAQGNNATAAAIASMREGGANARAKAKATGSGLDKMTIDQRISYLENKGAVEGLSDGEQGALENLKRFKLNQATVGKTGTTEDIMGLPSPGERAAAAAKGQAPTKKGTQQFQEGKVYQDANGNKAQYKNGQWIQLGGAGVPK